jgi:hypothetical protein
MFCFVSLFAECIKTVAMVTKVQTNFSEICKHVLDRGVPFLYTKHILIPLFQPKARRFLQNSPLIFPIQNEINQYHTFFKIRFNITHRSLFITVMVPSIQAFRRILFYAFSISHMCMLALNTHSSLICRT